MILEIAHLKLKKGIIVIHSIYFLISIHDYSLDKNMTKSTRNITDKKYQNC